ncbi:hypothetical protein JTE90_008083 [Oedothorax gibbosus]|uniref:Uncharacterized protein n=1 Tax=Oedothorax gibbosus TaxID=931172 RepID=A0AAV6TMW7_9ARAC|nr:hypothetical protein JTE90_008083 [Oedothorax gibbosus]
MRPRMDPSPPPPSSDRAGEVWPKPRPPKGIGARASKCLLPALLWTPTTAGTKWTRSPPWLRPALKTGAPSRTPYEPTSRYKGLSPRVTPAGPQRGGKGPPGSAFKAQRGPAPHRPPGDG